MNVYIHYCAKMFVVIKNKEIIEGKLFRKQFFHWLLIIAKVWIRLRICAFAVCERRFIIFAEPWEVKSDRHVPCRSTCIQYNRSNFFYWPNYSLIASPTQFFYFYFLLLEYFKKLTSRMDFTFKNSFFNSHFLQNPEMIWHFQEY